MMNESETYMAMVAHAERMPLTAVFMCEQHAYGIAQLMTSEDDE